MTVRGKGFRVCNSCGATLDPEETCECSRKKPEKKRYVKMRAVIRPIGDLDKILSGEIPPFDEKGE